MWIKYNGFSRLDMLAAVRQLGGSWTVLDALMHLLAEFQYCCVAISDRFYQLSGMELKQTSLMPL